MVSLHNNKPLFQNLELHIGWLTKMKGKSVFIIANIKEISKVTFKNRWSIFTGSVKLQI